MNDIDFDELDRAVSSTLNPPATPSADTAQTPVVSSTPTPSVSSAAASPAARRGGRFMDVVHPSSDMRGVPSVPARPAQPVVAASVATMPETVAAETPAPLESPFLPDAQVEKRPLGGELPTAELPADVPAEPVAESVVEPASEPIPEPVLESEHVSEPVLPEAAPEAEIIPTVTEPAAPEAVAPVQAVETAPVAEPTPPVDPVGPTSITPQYTEAPSSAEPSRPIFDTEAYHQPLAHPEKKKSGVFVVLWIIGLIILGAGLGAVMYFYVLPLL